MGLWVAALASGFTVLARYKNTPGRVEAGTSADWPVGTRLARQPGRASLVMFAHPHCPCTRASINELARLMPRLPAGTAAHVLFVRPSETAADWEQTDLWRSAASIPGVSVVRDDEGVEAARFHALTSGLTLVYDGGGHLLFHGGITASRGHEGDSFGQRRILSLLTTGQADRNDSPVFGCALGTGSPAGAKGLEDKS